MSILYPLLPQDNSTPPFFCEVCGETEPEKFYLRASGRQNGRACKSCRRIFYANLIRKQNLMGKYGLTVTQYEEMYQHQNGVCAICGNTEIAMDNTGTKIRALAVDHNHETGVIRGLLCGSCNYLIGYAKEDVDLLQSASEYLKRHKAAQEGA